MPNVGRFPFKRELSWEDFLFPKNGSLRWQRPVNEALHSQCIDRILLGGMKTVFRAVETEPDRLGDYRDARAMRRLRIHK